MSKAPATLVSSVLFYSPVRLCLRDRRAVSLTCPAVCSCPWCCFIHLSGCVFVPGMLFHSPARPAVFVSSVLFHSPVRLCLLAHGAVSLTCPAVCSCPACCFTHLPDRLCSCSACCFTHLSSCVGVQRAVSLTCQAVFVSSVLFHSPVKLWVSVQRAV